jgi:H+/Cl- antiporter ClcA
LCASLVGQAARFDPARLRLLVACGAAAGIASAYNAPIAGAFFITEIVLGSIAMDSLGPMMIAAVVANITMRRLPGYHPTYEMPAFPDVPNLEMALFALLGILAGLAAPHFLRLLGVASRAPTTSAAAPAAPRIVRLAATVWWTRSLASSNRRIWRAARSAILAWYTSSAGFSLLSTRGFTCCMPWPPSRRANTCLRASR